MLTKWKQSHGASILWTAVLCKTWELWPRVYTNSYTEPWNGHYDYLQCGLLSAARNHEMVTTTDYSAVCRLQLFQLQEYTQTLVALRGLCTMDVLNSKRGHWDTFMIGFNRSAIRGNNSRFDFHLIVMKSPLWWWPSVAWRRHNVALRPLLE